MSSVDRLSSQEYINKALVLIILLDEIKYATKSLDIATIEDTHMIHVLKEGFSLCRFNLDIPAKWPVGHTFVGYNEDNAIEEVTCPDCKEKLIDRVAVRLSN